MLLPLSLLHSRIALTTCPRKLVTALRCRIGLMPVAPPRVTARGFCNLQLRVVQEFGSCLAHCRSFAASRGRRPRHRAAPRTPQPRPLQATCRVPRLLRRRGRLRVLALLLLL